MPKYANKTDGNQQAIVDALRKIGATVIPLNAVKGGCPDLMVGFRGTTILIECKDESGRNRLEDSQHRFMETWNGGPVVVAHSPDGACALLGILAGRHGGQKDS